MEKIEIYWYNITEKKPNEDEWYTVMCVDGGHVALHQWCKYQNGEWWCYEKEDEFRIDHVCKLAGEVMLTLMRGFDIGEWL